MLKKLLAWFFSLVSLIFGLNDSQNVPQVTPTIVNPTVFPSPTFKNIIEINFENKDYLVYFAEISDKSIKLIPNFSQKESSQTIIEKENCKIAINGGYYTKEGKPLGLFETQGQVYSEEVTDQTLLTGFFSVDRQGKVELTSFAPNNQILILQAGPLILNGNKLKTKIDEEARRVVVAQTEDNRFYALILVQKEDLYSGPTLSNLPTVLFNIKSPFKVTKALNLDGGGSSIFYDNGFFISELQTVGSVICAF